MGNKMHQGIRDAWVARLRSGDYTQTKGALQYNGDFCCLGVLCEIAVEEGVIKAPTGTLGGATLYGARSIAEYDASTKVLPYAVMQWAGIETKVGEYSRNVNGIEIPESLAAMNDNGFSFEEIAEIIEAKF